MMPSGIKKIWSFFKINEMRKKILIIFVTLSNLNVRPVQSSILCTPTDSSEKTQMMCSTILLCLFTSKCDINGSRLNYSTVSSSKFKYI